VEGRPAGFANVRMTPTGSETDGVSAQVDTPLHHLASRGAAQSGADAAECRPIDPDLALLRDAWPTLPSHIKAAVLALVRAADK